MILVVVLMLLFGLYLIFDEKKYLKYGVIISIVIIASLFAFRNSVGVDDPQYAEIYNTVSAQNEPGQFLSNPHVEKTFLITSKGLSLLGLNYKALFLVYATVSFIFFYLIMKKMKLNKRESFIWLICFLAFSFTSYITIMRQFAAAMIAIYAVLCFDKKRKWNNIPCILLMIVSIFVHTTAIIIVPLAFIKNIKGIYNKWLLIGLPVALFLLNLVGIWRLIEPIGQFLPKFNAYASQVGVKTEGNLLIVLALYAIYIISILLERKKHPNVDLKDTQTRTIELFGLVFFSLFFFTKDNGAIYRIMFPFILFRGASVLPLMKYIPKKYAEIGTIAVALVLSGAAFYAVHTNKMNLNFDNYSINLIEKKSGNGQ